MMLDEPISGQNPNRPFSTLQMDYTTQYNPEVARRQGYTRGALDHNEFVLKYIKTTFKKPNKQMQELVEKLQETGKDINDN